MFERENFSLSPLNFFQIVTDCHRLKKDFPSLASQKNELYALPSTALLTNDEIFSTLFMGWSEEGIELFIVVQKPVESCFYPDVSKGDSVELFFDTRDVKTSGFNTKFCHHFFFLPEAVEGHQKGELTKFRGDETHELVDSSELTLKVKKSAKGYSLEIFIPKEALYGFEPGQFGRMGFTYRVNRYQGSSQSFSVKDSEYQIEQQPSLWSSLILTKESS